MLRKNFANSRGPIFGAWTNSSSSGCFGPYMRSERLVSGSMSESYIYYCSHFKVLSTCRDENLQIWAVSPKITLLKILNKKKYFSNSIFFNSNKGLVFRSTILFLFTCGSNVWQYLTSTVIVLLPCSFMNGSGQILFWAGDFTQVRPHPKVIKKLQVYH